MASDDRPWATGATHDERWAGYLDPDTGMLRTLSAEPMRTPEELREFEDSRATVRAMELRLNPIRGTSTSSTCRRSTATCSRTSTRGPARFAPSGSRRAGRASSRPSTSGSSLTVPLG